MKIIETLTWANNKLKTHTDLDPKSDAKLESSMLDAQLLMASVLNVSKNYLFTHLDQILNQDQLEKFEALITRRMHHEPIAYILGWKEFFNKPFRVNPFVLIPRPDTEILVDEAIKIAKDATDTLFIDLGTGSGAVAVSIAAETNLPVIATDVSIRALKLAEQNAKINNVENRLTFLEGDLLEPIKRQITKGLDQVVITANLPYLSTKQWEITQPEVKDYEPRLALDGGVDGLEVYSTLFQELLKRRSDFPKKLTVLIEIDPSQSFTAPRMIRQYFATANVRVVNDLAGKVRVVIVEL